MDLEQLVIELLRSGQEDFNTVLNKVANGFAEYGIENPDIDVTLFYMDLAKGVTDVNKEFSQELQKRMQEGVDNQ
jgi:hypothetical protein